MNIPPLTSKTLQNNGLPSPSTANDKVQGADKEVPQQPRTTVNVDITEMTKHIAHAFNTSSESAPAIDKARVNPIIAALNNGSYTIDAESIAEKIMQMGI